MKPLIVFFLASVLLFDSCRKANGDIDNFDDHYLYNPYSWYISSTPNRFVESQLVNNLGNGFNRAHLAWYTIDPIFQKKTGDLTPEYLTDDDLSNHYTRIVKQKEIYNVEGDTNVYLNIFNIAYYPSERGQYNFESYSTQFSKGINSEGKLNNPETRWAGIQYALEPNIRKVTYIDFWLMDPFIYKSFSGDLYINIGDISEDVLRDNKHNDESKLFSSDLNKDTSVWGHAYSDDITNSNYFNDREKVDVGLDGLNNGEEKVFFSQYLENIRKIIINDSVYNSFIEDPSNDNFHYFSGDEFTSNKTGILGMYKRFNGFENNSPYASNSFITPIYTSLPDKEDINNNNDLDTSNNYFEYHISINKSDFVIGKNNLDLTHSSLVTLRNGKQENVTWYHFRIPIENYENKIGQLNSGLNPSSIRIYLTNFKEDVVLRFASMNLSYN